MNVKLVLFFPTEFRRESVGDVSAEVDFLLATLDFRADVRVGTVSLAGMELVAVAFPPPRLRFLMTSVLSDRGRTTPWSFRNNPHALQRG